MITQAHDANTPEQDQYSKSEEHINIIFYDRRTTFVCHRTTVTLRAFTCELRQSFHSNVYSSFRSIQIMEQAMQFLNTSLHMPRVHLTAALSPPQAYKSEDDAPGDRSQEPLILLIINATDQDIECCNDVLVQQ